ncbi:hypothetical protein HanPI659440_Chr12g0449121 [Helianthus annuus]|nr:hypothetical protein HanPI659440_Chr12g0449121 [Helianthus annuus]
MLIIYLLALIITFGNRVCHQIDSCQAGVFPCRNKHNGGVFIISMSYNSSVSLFAHCLHASFEISYICALNMNLERIGPNAGREIENTV